MAAVESITAELLQGLASGRAYPMHRPQQGALPAVVWSVISCVPQGRISMSTGTNLWSARVQVDAVAKTYAEMKTLMDQVRAAMHLKSGTYASKTVVSVLLDQQAPEYADLDAGIYVQPQDFFITFYD